MPNEPRLERGFSSPDIGLFALNVPLSVRRRPSSRCRDLLPAGGEKGQAANSQPYPAGRCSLRGKEDRTAPRVSFAPLGTRRCRQADEGHPDKG
ncbi:hypothetical protein CN124_05635 [Sinorhizobium meliloti]|nr:hypothetical protein CN125_18425 [Sinorhizobium meliloti]RVM70693.1 hypothetical protein CN124_05635 [Sinorhizobium meliloti]RVM81457.1 hypothetical protein CN117_22795 [Sinorhizobium meliloti]